MASSECGTIRLCLAIEDESKRTVLSRASLKRKDQMKQGKRTLHILLVSCSDLLPKDANGLSDPFVVFTFGGQRRQKSKVVYKDLNPVYNQSFSFSVAPTVLLEDPEQFLHVTVYDRDRFHQKDFIGHVQLPLADIKVVGKDGAADIKPFEQSYVLRPKSYYEVHQENTKEFAKKKLLEKSQSALTGLAYSSFKYVDQEAPLASASGTSTPSAALLGDAATPTLAGMSCSASELFSTRPDPPLRKNHPPTPTFQFAGSIYLAIDYRKSEKELSVLAVCADDVDAKDKSGLSDPFVELDLGEGSRPRKSPVEKKTLNPFWNHQFNLVVPAGATTLTVSVYDWNHSGRELIGTTQILLQSLPACSERWYVLNSQAVLGSAVNAVQIEQEDEEDRLADERNRPIRRQRLRDRQFDLAQREYDAYQIKYHKKQATKKEELQRATYVKLLWFVFAFFLFLALLSL